MPATPANIAIFVFQAALLLAGTFLLWRHALRSSARRALQEPAPLPAWTAPLPDFLLFLLIIIGGGVLGSMIASGVLTRFTVTPDTKQIIGTAGFQLGLLGGAVLALLSGRGRVPAPIDTPPSILRSGIAVFLMVLPVVTVASYAWLALLDACGLPADQQDLLRLFNETSSPALLTLMVVLATVVAPISEELLFRATLFRYLRTRWSRPLALFVPGAVFAMLHVNWSNLDGLSSLVPLVTLAVFFSIAYERTGRIGTVIVAHGLFNLHTVLVLLVSTRL